MPAMKRQKTNYPGVFYVDGTDDKGKPEKIFYIRYRRAGRVIEEKAGRQFQNDMTAAKANHIRSERINGKALSNQETRKEKNKKVMTLGKIFDEYLLSRSNPKSVDTDKRRFDKYLSNLSDKAPSELVQGDIDRLKQFCKKSGIADQTIKHVLNLLTQTITYGVKRGYCSPLQLLIEKPKVKNILDDALNKDQVSALMKAIDESENIQVGNMMKLALFTGMRRGELFNLKWADFDMNSGLLTITESKSGKVHQIPLNELALEVLKNHPKKTKYVFPGEGGKRRVTCGIAARKIMDDAGIPKTVRPMHSLRHTFATLLAGSGKFQMFEIQKLLTHSTVTMTERYAAYRDAALKISSDKSNEVLTDIIGEK